MSQPGVASETSGVWLLHLVVGGHRGHTLWVTDELFPDRLLAVGGSVALFPTMERLSDFVASRHPTNLDSTDGYASLQIDAGLLERVLSAPIKFFDLDDAAALLADADSVPSLEQLGAILDALWMAIDIATTLDERAILELMGGDAPLGELIDLLTATVTLLGEGSVVYHQPDIAWRSTPPLARSAFIEIIARLEPRITDRS